MRSTFRSLKMIIVDEVSMVSSLNLAYMHLRLEELFGGHGKECVICWGLASVAASQRQSRV